MPVRASNSPRIGMSEAARTMTGAANRPARPPTRNLRRVVSNIFALPLVFDLRLRRVKRLAHAALEGLDAAAEVLHNRADAAAAEQDAHYPSDDDPVHN